MNPFELPVYKQKDKILSSLAQNQVIVVESPTGSGKTTQIPQILYEAGYTSAGIIGVTQPRRIAAVSVTEFIARQMAEKYPDQAGSRVAAKAAGKAGGRTAPKGSELVAYKMRFEDQTTPSTQIKIMTDGILLQEMKADYMLSRYSVIMVDEAHERSLNIDFILGLLKHILEARPNFKVIISSATINAEIFSEYFDECPIVKIDTISYPVDVLYQPLKKENDYNLLIETIVERILQIVNETKIGDILVFVSGEKAIKDCIFSLRTHREASRMEILPLYARLSSEEQERIFLDFPGKRKVVVATNIAETSVTIEGIRFVIDSGLAKMNYYNQRTFTSSLVEIPIAKASCNQRKGRAGRTAPGCCYRIYSKKDFEARPLFNLEEILRTDLSEVVLRMTELGIRDFENFDFISPPDKQGIVSAIESLKFLNAIDDERNLTEIGKMMSLFPMLPKHSRIIVEAVMRFPEVLEEALIAASFLTTNSPFLLPHGEEVEARRAHHEFSDPFGDFISYQKIYESFMNSHNKKGFCERHYLDLEVMSEIVNIKNQLTEIVTDMNVPVLKGGSTRDYLCAVSKGLIQFVCRRTDRGVYRSLTAEKIQIHPGSVMFKENPPYMVAGEIVKTTRMYARSVSRLEKNWLKEISPLLFDGLVIGTAAEGKKRARDFTNQIRIGVEIFKIQKEKGKKIVVLPWARLKAALVNLDLGTLTDYKDIKGRIVINNYSLMDGVKLKTILQVAQKIDPEADIVHSWPQKNLPFPEAARTIVDWFPKLLSLCKTKKKTKRLGFLALLTDGAGTYWLRSSKSFFAALSESLSSLDSLMDELAADLSATGKDGTGEYLNEEQRKQLGLVYRRLNSLLES